jgi:D-psicose/D-tagatose/L-ribulose 3-epimerase
MKLAISCIAWKQEDELEVAKILTQSPVSGVEVVPGRLGADLLKVTERDARDYREFWQKADLPIVAMQALLFGRSDLLIFGSESKREELKGYLKSLFQVAEHLGAKSLVFGSPKNRQKGSFAEDEANKVAIEFFSEVGAMAADHNTKLVIEPVTKEYGCDFIMNVEEAGNLVAQVNSPGFGLHIDTAALALAGESVQVAQSLSGSISHFHVSEPDLKPINADSKAPHAELAQILAESGYQNWISIEMRDTGSPIKERLSEIEAVCKYVFSVYNRKQDA